MLTPSRLLTAYPYFSVKTGDIESKDAKNILDKYLDVGEWVLMRVCHSWDHLATLRESDKHYFPLPQLLTIFMNDFK